MACWLLVHVASQSIGLRVQADWNRVDVGETDGQRSLISII